MYTFLKPFFLVAYIEVHQNDDLLVHLMDEKRNDLIFKLLDDKNLQHLQEYVVSYTAMKQRNLQVALRFVDKFRLDETRFPELMRVRRKVLTLSCFFLFLGDLTFCNQQVMIWIINDGHIVDFADDFISADCTLLDFLCYKLLERNKWEEFIFLAQKYNIRITKYRLPPGFSDFYSSTGADTSEVSMIDWKPPVSEVRDYLRFNGVLLFVDNPGNFDLAKVWEFLKQINFSYFFYFVEISTSQKCRCYWN